MQAELATVKASVEAGRAAQGALTAVTICQACCWSPASWHRQRLQQRCRGAQAPAIPDVTEKKCLCVRRCREQDQRQGVDEEHALGTAGPGPEAPHRSAPSPYGCTLLHEIMLAKPCEPCWIRLLHTSTRDTMSNAQMTNLRCASRLHPSSCAGCCRQSRLAEAAARIKARLL